MITNEEIREKIRIMVDKANVDLNLPIVGELNHMLTSICFVMYKQGMDDGFNLALATIQNIKQKMKVV
jgi:hypothetical protein